MKKYLVIGNPIIHSLSPELHNYWLRENNINGIYNKEQLDKNDLKKFFLKIKKKEINGANITVPFKKDVISYVDQLSLEAEKTQSVNTVHLKNNKNKTFYNLTIRCVHYFCFTNKVSAIWIESRNHMRYSF